MVGVLPSALFCSGHVFFTQSLPKALGVLPYAVHATFQFSGTPGKKNRFREAMLWYDKPEYYRSKSECCVCGRAQAPARQQWPGRMLMPCLPAHARADGFIAYEPALSKQLLEGGGPRTNKMDIANTIGHFELVNHQLLEVRGSGGSHLMACVQAHAAARMDPTLTPLAAPLLRATPTQLRHALALATILNRTLILPPLWCGLDRYWAPHDGRLPGSQFDLPFLCPADHVLDLESECWLRGRPACCHAGLPAVMRAMQAHCSPAVPQTGSRASWTSASLGPTSTFGSTPSSTTRGCRMRYPPRP